MRYKHTDAPVKLVALAEVALWRPHDVVLLGTVPRLEPAALALDPLPDEAVAHGVLLNERDLAARDDRLLPLAVDERRLHRGLGLRRAHAQKLLHAHAAALAAA